MTKGKSPRNKTIELSSSEIEHLSGNLLSLDEKVDKERVINRTILQDAFKAIDYLPDRFIDLLLVDPPYNMNKNFRSKSFKKLDSNEYEKWIYSWVDKITSKLKPTASIYVCGDWQSSSALYRVLSHYFQVRNRITWEREKGRGAKTNWKNASEDIWFATVGSDYYFNVEAVKLKKKVIAPYRDSLGKPKDWAEEENGNFRLTHPSNLWTDLTVPFWSMPENTNHPTQKPEKLIAKIILASSKEGDVVFDPFLGSGTTSVVAKKLGREYLGIEIDKYYACLAEKRLEMADLDKRIQGYSDGVFWERNIRPEITSAVAKQQRLLL
jgi:site-specific DNA-methyltransferase (adenine-specific)